MAHRAVEEYPLAREGQDERPHLSAVYRAALTFFFFQAEDGIRDLTVTGVQTCALPISQPGASSSDSRLSGATTSPAIAATAGSPNDIVASRSGPFGRAGVSPGAGAGLEIGRASCRERV